MGRAVRTMAIVVVFAGCLQPLPAPSVAAPPLAGETPSTSLSFACGADPAVVADGFCLDLLDVSLQELQHDWIWPLHVRVAIDEDDPTRMAVAWAHAWEAPPEPHVEHSPPYVDIVRAFLFVTSDGGLTWRSVTPPYWDLLGMQITPLNQPVDVVKDLTYRNGTLHIAAYLSDPHAAAHVATDDQGLTWKSAARLAATGTRSEPYDLLWHGDSLYAYVAHYEVSPPVSFTLRSDDAGQTWRTRGSCTVSGQGLDPEPEWLAVAGGRLHMGCGGDPFRWRAAGSDDSMWHEASRGSCWTEAWETTPSDRWTWRGVPETSVEAACPWPVAIGNGTTIRNVRPGDLVDGASLAWFNPTSGIVGDRYVVAAIIDDYDDLTKHGLYLATIGPDLEIKSSGRLLRLPTDPEGTSLVSMAGTATCSTASGARVGMVACAWYEELYWARIDVVP